MESFGKLYGSRAERQKLVIYISKVKIFPSRSLMEAACVSSD